jgi:DNA repair exonuclease SbcCD ATPase subunit
VVSDQLSVGGNFAPNTFTDHWSLILRSNMNEQMTTQLAAVAERLAAAAESLERAMGERDGLAAKVDRIVASIDERAETESAGAKELEQRLAALERENAELKTKAAELHAHAGTGRKTISPLVSGLLSKSGVEEARFDPATLDKALSSLALDQRVAVKAEMARAGMIE